MNRNFDVVIIGGGAAGLFLAARLKKTIRAAIVEASDRVGKKLLASGNGKCNLTNVDMDASHFNSPNLVAGYLMRFGADDAMKAFGDMGLVMRTTDGRVYPYSECASTVLDVLRSAVAAQGAEIFTGVKATSITAYKDSYEIFCEDKTGKQYVFRTSSVVLATGSVATFGTDSLLLYKNFGHTVKPWTPSLAPILTEREAIKGLQGVRVKAGARLNDRRVVGEVLFKEIGLSGVAIFDLSSELARGKAGKGDRIYLDFMPDMTAGEVEKLLGKMSGGSVADMLRGVFHTRLQERIAAAANVSLKDKASMYAARIADVVKNYPVVIEGAADASLAQAMSGGLALSEFDVDLMSVRKRGAYAVGEVLDVDGDSGGYNLQWAWTSAAIVANAINKANK